MNFASTFKDLSHRHMVVAGRAGLAFMRGNQVSESGIFSPAGTYSITSQGTCINVIESNMQPLKGHISQSHPHSVLSKVSILSDQKVMLTLGVWVF